MGILRAFLSTGIFHQITTTTHNSHNNNISYSDIRKYLKSDFKKMALNLED
jgi:hypothetical protein